MLTDLFGGALPTHQPKEPPVAATSLMKNVRPARKDLGDDISFSRFVKLPGYGKTHGKQAQPRVPGLALPAHEEGRTYFPKSVSTVEDMQAAQVGLSVGQPINLLKSGHNNVKIGRDVRIGKLVGYWLYYLTLQERASCPRSCHHWQDCYGNHMAHATRVDHRSEGFLPALQANIERLLAVRGWPGIIIRLHALGDFYSPEYVGFWDEMLTAHPTLVIFGYTAWLKDTAIGAAVDALIDKHPGRAMIHFSDGGYATRSTVSIVDAEDCPPGAFVCPEQTEQFEACGKCGACWTTLKNVAFMAH